uniref:Protein phosphatase putative n=1 Tax=Albugo laibachii Nc14 TaxID=890382 RepID=F0WV69_9STRA|nr:protein phosphatase putative [Albugo laibachii Nc14]|eukprot:CCA25308.1 protein phosphatase putative [Albugo laibachii Nc14]
MQNFDSNKYDSVRELTKVSTSCCQHNVLFIKDDLSHTFVQEFHSLESEDGSSIEAEPVNQSSRRIAQNVSFVTGTKELDEIENDQKDSISLVKNAKYDQDSIVFVASTNKKPASPCSPITQMELPWKDEVAFYDVQPGFTTTEEPSTVVQCLKKAAHVLNAQIKDTEPWNFKVSCLCAAEEVQFSLHLFQVNSSEATCSVEFVQQKGDESKFVCISDWLIDNWEYFISDAWTSINDVKNLPFEWTQSRESRNFAISTTQANTLIEELNADLHPETLYEITREIKDHCRHSGNRKQFQQQDHSGFLKGIKWMLLDSDEIARFAVFILLQFAENMNKDDSNELFQTTYETNTFKLAVSSLAQDEGSVWTRDSARKLLTSHLFRP